MTQVRPSWAKRMRSFEDNPLFELISRNVGVRRTLAVARKEIRQLWRDRLTLGFVVGVPAAQLLLFGYAINQDIRHIQTAVVDHSATSVSRQLIGRLEATQTFEVVARPGSEAAARALMQSGQVKAVISIPPEYGTAFYRGRKAEILVLVDATDPTLARAAKTSAEGLMKHQNVRLQPFDTGAPASAMRLPRHRSTFVTESEQQRQQLLELKVLNLYNPELRTPVFVVPALLGVILTTTTILMTALAVVRERERGSLEFLIATPVRRRELMGGKILPYIGIGLLQIGIVVTAGLLLFRVPIAGSLVDLSIASLVFIAANLSLGLVISSRSQTQFQATQLSFFFFLPSVLLSGFMFPFSAMPIPAQWLGELLPLTHFVRICRAILLRGSPLTNHPIDLFAMALFAALGFLAATRLFSKRLA